MNNDMQEKGQNAIARNLITNVAIQMVKDIHSTTTSV